MIIGHLWIILFFRYYYYIFFLSIDKVRNFFLKRTEFLVILARK